MSPLKAYKKAEASFAQKAGSAFRRFFSSTGNILRSFWANGRKKFTIMLIPHSERKVFNFQVSVFMLAGLLAVLCGLLLSFLWFATKYTGDSQLEAQRKSRDSNIQASLDGYRAGAAELAEVWGTFKTAILGSTGKKSTTNAAPGDLSAFRSADESAVGGVQETADLKLIASDMRAEIPKLLEQAKTRSELASVMSEIPTAWPVKGGLGHISAYYGYNTNPFTGIWYLHTGLDISTGRIGDPVVATANGTVVFAGNNASGYGNYIIIEHNLGIYTLYAHLDRINVLKGARVKKGDSIGRLGNTGLSTGPHLHYEVRYGSGYTDPLRFVLSQSDSTLGAW